MASIYVSWIKLMCSQFKCTVPLCLGKGLSLLSLGLASLEACLLQLTQEKVYLPHLLTGTQGVLLNRNNNFWAGGGATNLGMGWGVGQPIWVWAGGWDNQSGSVWFSTGVPRFQYVLVELFTLQRLKLLKLLNAPNSANTGQCLNTNVTNSTTITVRMLLIHINPPLSIPGTHLAV